SLLALDTKLPGGRRLPHIGREGGADGLEERPGRQATEKFARAAGTPFISFFSPPEMLALPCEAGFREAQHVSAAGLTQRYFAGRTDGLRPSSSEELLVATT